MDRQPKAPFERFLREPSSDVAGGIELRVELDDRLPVSDPPLVARHDSGSVRLAPGGTIPRSTEPVGLLIDTCGKIEMALSSSLP